GAAATPNKGLIRFDLSGMSGVGASDVQKAVVWLYVNRVTTAGAIDVQDLTTTWVESTVTWNAAPVAGATLGTIQVTAANQWVGLNTTRKVRGWRAPPSTTCGLMLSAGIPPTTPILLDTKENTSTTHPAQLQIGRGGRGGAPAASGPAGPTGA